VVLTRASISKLSFCGTISKIVAPGAITSPFEKTDRLTIVPSAGERISILFNT
jgi:hypothetical protein